MEITEISVSWSETITLPEYSNARPGISLSAILEDGDIPEHVRDALLCEAKQFVHGQVDAILEANNRPPKYYNGPRFQYLRSPARQCIIIMSDDTNDWPDGFTHFFGNSRGLRFPIVKKLAEEKAKSLGWIVLDCTDGDFSNIPEPIPPNDKERPPF